MQMTKSNWARFDTHNKKTTIRTHKFRVGIHNVWGGPRFKPVKHGVIEVFGDIQEKKVCELNERDAKDDGFDSLCELLIELAHLNRGLAADTIVYKYRVDKK